MKVKLTPITAKWIGLRAETRGSSWKLLKRAGFWRDVHASLNNRHGADFIQPCGARTLADFAPLFEKLTTAGFRGVAFQWTDIQWKHNAGLTDSQWQSRVQIG